jgi:superfamily I DNA/RNA helicase
LPWPPTPEQEAFIAHDVTGCARLLAGPGTGKSAAVIRLILGAAADQQRIGRLLTFTRAATNELKEKVAEHPEALATPNTVHSFSISTLLSNPGASGLPEPIRIADDWEWKELIREHLKALVGCSVRLIERARQEMASNWESLEPSEDPELPEDVRNRFAGGSSTESFSGTRCSPNFPIACYGRLKIIPTSSWGPGTTWLLMSTRISTSATYLC